MPNLVVPLLKFAAESHFLTLIHGDARLDNWYFDDKTGEPGTFDFQQACKGPCYIDVAWCLTNSFPDNFYYEHRQTLLELYWSSLIKKLRDKGVDVSSLHFEDFLFGYNLFNIFGLGKSILAVDALLSSTDTVGP